MRTPLGVVPAKSVFLAAAILLAAGVAAMLLTGRGHAVEGTMTLIDDGFSDAGIGCSGSGGYDDIDLGTDVMVRDETGKILANGELGIGHERNGTCVFDFTVEDVPKADFYEVEISHRGGLTYSYKEMDERDWTMAVSLG